MLPRFLSQIPFCAAMLPRFLSQMPLVEEKEIEEVQPLQFQQKSLPAIASTEFVEPIVAGSMFAEVEQELATLLEETRIPQKEHVKQLCSCRSVESLSSSYNASSDAYSSSSDNGEDIESNTEEVPIENEEEAVSELKSAPVFAAPERPRSCPPMGISQKYSIREIRDPRLQAVRRWAQQSEALAIAEEPSTSSDESHSDEGDYDYDLERSPPLSPISSANDSEGEWAVDSLDKLPTIIGITEIEAKDELAMLPPPLESQEIQVQSVSTEWLTTTEAPKETISVEAVANSNPFITSFVMLEELPMVPAVELKEIETQKTEITLPEAFKEIEAEKVEITIPEFVQEVESKAVIISVAEVVKEIQVQKKKSQKRKLPMKQRLRNSKKRTGKN